MPHKTGDVVEVVFDLREGDVIVPKAHPAVIISVSPLDQEQHSYVVVMLSHMAKHDRYRVSLRFEDSYGTLESGTHARTCVVATVFPPQMRVYDPPKKLKPQIVTRIAEHVTEVVLGLAFDD